MAALYLPDKGDFFFIFFFFINNYRGIIEMYIIFRIMTFRVVPARCNITPYDRPRFYFICFSSTIIPKWVFRILAPPRVAQAPLDRYTFPRVRIIRILDYSFCPRPYSSRLSVKRLVPTNVSRALHRVPRAAALSRLRRSNRFPWISRVSRIPFKAFKTRSPRIRIHQYARKKITDFWIFFFFCWRHG